MIGHPGRPTRMNIFKTNHAKRLSPPWLRIAPTLTCLAVIAAASTTIAAEMSFNRDIRPILSDNCYACHGPDEKRRKAGLRLDIREAAIREHKGSRGIHPGHPESSAIMDRITTGDAEDLMPPPDSNKTLFPEEIELLREWIKQGAGWQDHWAFVQPTRPAVPATRESERLVNPIDAFVARRLEQEDLHPSEEAQREILIRRATFDLTGLPPTPSEVNDFVNDPNPNAYEKVIDRLLASERYGERMTVMWLDAARYGDTSVFHADGPRDMWPWRDWVINAYNANMPFDQFTVEQLAGDLLPGATVDQQVASAFNRNNGTTDEGGAIAEEYRVEYAVDRVKTTATIWMALTMECAQCHDHKYDPISQKEYYGFFAYFNQSADKGMQTRKGNEPPLVSFFTEDQEIQIKGLSQSIAGSDAALNDHRPIALKNFAAWDKQLSQSKGDALPPPPNLVHYFPLDTAGDGELVDSVSGSVGKVSKGKIAATERAPGKPALNLNGKTVVQFEGLKDIDHDTPFTFSTWVRLPKGQTGGPVFARMNVANAHRGYDLWIQGNAVGVHFISSWPANALKVVSLDKLKTEKWQHIAVTYDGKHKAAGLKIYIDGKLSKNKIEQNSLSKTTITTVPFQLAARSNGGGTKLDVDDIKIFHRALSQAELKNLDQDPIKQILALAPKTRTKDQVALLQNHFLLAEDKTYAALTAKRKTLLGQKQKVEAAKMTTMIMGEAMPMRPTYLLNRGSYDTPMKDKAIPTGVPAALNPLPKDAPQNRLGLARWVVNPANPLTARVAVNRYWQMFFGNGLVTTVDDFGSQGEWPSHPALLDWLAVDFTDSDWDVKRMIKQMLMSATYRQSSRITPELQQRDPGNRLLARGPRFRLQGEFIRDNALALAGLLIDTVGGPGVKPYQPPGLWNEVSLGGNVRFVADKGRKLYRRSMYTYWKRSSPAPSMIIFDAPSREKCVVKRQRTNTPLQALVTLNDPQFIEASRAIAERVMLEGGKTDADKIEFAWKLVTARSPSMSRSQALQNLFQEELSLFKKQPDKAKELLAVGDSERSANLDPARHAAWTVIANLLLNMDEALTRG
jgi:hypothetical protein